MRASFVAALILLVTATATASTPALEFESGEVTCASAESLADPFNAECPFVAQSGSVWVSGCSGMFCTVHVVGSVFADSPNSAFKRIVSCIDDMCNEPENPYCLGCISPHAFCAEETTASLSTGSTSCEGYGVRHFATPSGSCQHFAITTTLYEGSRIAGFWVDSGTVNDLFTFCRSGDEVFGFEPMMTS